MPLYEYRCTQCGHRFEKIQHFKSKPETVCPKCHGKLERPLNAPAFRFKGSGWYVTDYAGKNEASASGHNAAASPAPAKPAKPTKESKPAAPAATPAPSTASAS